MWDFESLNNINKYVGMIEIILERIRGILLIQCVLNVDDILLMVRGRVFVRCILDTPSPNYGESDL